MFSKFGLFGGQKSPAIRAKNVDGGLRTSSEFKSNGPRAQRFTAAEKPFRRGANPDSSSMDFVSYFLMKRSRSPGVF